MRAVNFKCFDLLLWSEFERFNSFTVSLYYLAEDMENCLNSTERISN